MAPEIAAIVVLAGFLAGAINAAAGGGTLITFPVLVWLGVPPISANISSSVGLLSGYLGGSLAYRNELREQKDRVLRFSSVALAGGIVGALLLLVTSVQLFDALVPFLVLGSAALLAIQPKLSRFFSNRRKPGATSSTRVTATAVAAQVGIFLAAIYGSYFGAGLGVLLLAVLALTLDDDLQRLNGLKSLLSLFVNFVGVLVFIVGAQVDWLLVALLAPSALLGGTVGGRVARKLPPTVLRAVVVVFATISGVYLFVN